MACRGENHEVKPTQTFLELFLDFCPQTPTQLTDRRVAHSVVGLAPIEHPPKV